MSKRFSQASGGFAWVLAMAACLCSISATSPAVARAAGSNRIEFWVSARGSDRAAGSQSHPFRTLAKARDAVRAARRSDGRAKISVYLLAGTYRLTRPLVLDWRDSGRAGAAVVWRAAPGAHPVISGAVRVQGWTLHDATRGIYEARVVRGLQTRQLYVDGSRALRARSGIYPPGFTRTPSGFRAPSDSMASWRNLRSIEAVTRTQWQMMRCPVRSIRGRDIVMRQPCWTFAYGTWPDPSSPHGYADDQSGFHLDGRGHRTNLIGHDPDTTRTPGNVRLRYARHVMFTHDDFLHLGGVGLDFDTGSQHDAVVGNRFDDISSAATELGGVSPVDHHPAHRGQVTLDNTISNNLITNIGREYQDAAGVYVGFTTRSRVEHNDIRNVPWSGIAIGWGWGLLDPTGFLGLPAAVPGQWGSYRKPTTSAGNELVDNRI